MAPRDGHGPAAPERGSQAFRPPPLLRNADVQAALASSGWRRRLVEREARSLAATTEDLIVECRDGTRLLAHHTPPPPGRQARGVAVLLHGWEGSARSLHVLSAASRLHGAGMRVMRINMRDHGDSHHLNRGIFHSCRLDEMVDAVRWVAERHPGEPLYLAGFSLGGNFALRIANVLGTSVPLARVVAVCPVLDPEETMVALDRGPLIYRWYFLLKWRRSLERKASLFPADYAFGPLQRFRTLTAMTDFFVRNYTEFEDLPSYLRGYAITGPRLAGLTVPSTLLLAEDDPVIPVGALVRVARPPALTVEQTRFGGHCGFIRDYRLQSWIDDYLEAAFLPPSL